MKKISGSFEVAMAPAEMDASVAGEGAELGRFVLDKKYAGELEAVGKGEMLSARSTEGSAAYVAIERITGTLDGRRGSFVVQHSGTMSAAGQELSVRVVPDSGAGELIGIAGVMNIRIENGKHFYDLEYELPDA